MFAKEIKFSEIDREKFTLVVEGKTYHWDGSKEPEHQADDVYDYDISYWPLHNENGELTDMLLAFDNMNDKGQNLYNIDNPHVLKI